MNVLVEVSPGKFKSRPLRGSKDGWAFVSIKDDVTLSSLGGATVIQNAMGASGNLVPLPTSGIGPDEFYVDLAEFSSTDIRLVLITSANAINWTVDVSYYYDNPAEDHDATTLLGSATGSRSAALPKLDRFCKIIVSAMAAGETFWLYVVGRENS